MNATRSCARASRARCAALGTVGSVLVLLLGRAAWSAPIALGDTTTVETWRLANGLQVTARDVPGAPGVAVTLAFPTGSDADPPGREGQAELVAETFFLAGAGEVPERKMAELPSARPLGFDVELGPDVTRFTEVATREQFAGVLHQLALRLRAPRVTASAVAEAQREVKSELPRRYRDDVPSALYYGVRCVATAQGAAAVERYASAKGLEGTGARDVQRLVAERYVPAHAVLSLAGDLGRSGIDLHRAIEVEFGSIPAGAGTVAQASPLSPVRMVATRPGIPYALGVVGVIGPALVDSSHPSFYLHMLLAGASFTARWGRSDLTPWRMKYLVLDEPRLVRFFPPVTASDVDSSRIREEVSEGLIALQQSAISAKDFQELRYGVRWQLGGALSDELRRRARTDPPVLAALSAAAATRLLRGDEGFWADYLRRFDGIERPQLERWEPSLRVVDQQAQILLLPEPERSP